MTSGRVMMEGNWNGQPIRPDLCGGALTNNRVIDADTAPLPTGTGHRQQQNVSRTHAWEMTKAAFIKSGQRNPRSAMTDRPA